MRPRSFVIPSPEATEVNVVQDKNIIMLPLALKHLASVLGDKGAQHAHLHTCDHDSK